MEKVISFRSSSKPFVALWSVGDAQAYGSVVWVGSKPILTLFVEVETTDNGLVLGEVPILKATEPPIQATITGTVPGYGVVTLEGCACYNMRTTHYHHQKRVAYELEFLPVAVWIGASKDEVDGQICFVVAGDSRLTGFFGSPGFQTFRSFDPDTKELFSAIGSPRYVWAAHGPDEHKIELGESGWLLSLYTETVEGSSATEGHSLKSAIKIQLNSPKPASVMEASGHLSRLEEIISTFSIEAFTFQYEVYFTQGSQGIALVWRLGEDRSLFQSPMRHQILINLSDPVILRAVCRQWYLASTTVALSRWLFVRALRETDDGLARFVAVAQAFEVLGRELGPNIKLPKKRMREAVGLVREALLGKFDDGFIDRVVGLIRSSNRSSYADILSFMLERALQRVDPSAVGSMKDFSKLVADTRNDVVHMNSDEKGKLNEAFARVHKLSLRLCFWYAVCQADHMDIEVPDAATFAANNRNARHGLPNELLERW